MQVTGKVVVVTGGASGIGRALCEAFNRAGAAKVVVVDIDPDGARTVAGTCRTAPERFACRMRSTAKTPSRRFGDDRSAASRRARIVQAR